MKYRVAVTVSAERIGAVISAAFEGGEDPHLNVVAVEPEWGTYAAGRAEGEAMLAKTKAAKLAALAAGAELARKPKKPKTMVLPGDVAGIVRSTKTGRVVTNRRAQVLEAALKTGPKRWSELRAALSDGGLSESSLNNMVGQWKKSGKIARTADGLWILKDDEAQRADAG